MKIHRLITLLLSAVFGAGCFAHSQTVSGTTSVDIDPDLGIVTATCETDLDDYAQNYYQAAVVCRVVDSNGTVVASENQIDYDNVGYVQVVLTLNGTPGLTYTATGFHKGILEYVDETDPLPPPHTSQYYYDYYNFSSFEGSAQAYPNQYEWFGPGPEVKTQKQAITAGSTNDIKTRVFTLSEISQLITDSQNAFSSHCDTVFTAKIVPAYTNANFFNQLRVTGIQQYPNKADPNMPSHELGADADSVLNKTDRPIRFFPNFYTVPRTYQEFVLIHEGIHRYTGWDHPTIFDAFRFAGLKQVNPDSGDITDWLQRGCTP